MKKRIGIVLMVVFALHIKIFAFDTALYNEKISELKNLLSQCETAGLACPYEKMYITTMEQFTDDRTLGNESYVAARLDEIYEKTKSALNEYKNGTKTPLAVPQYQTSDITISRTSMIADTTWGKRPVFFVGYGHFDEAKNAFPVFSDIGANITQQEIGVWNVIYEAKKPYGWTQSVSGTTDFDAGSHYDKDNVRGGDVSLKLGLHSASGYVSFTQEYDVAPNTTYTYSLTAKSDSGGSAFFSPGNNKIYLDQSSAWKTYKGSFTTGEETKKTFRITAEKKSLSYVDNISVKREDLGENILNNGNFEKNANVFGTNNEYIAVTDRIEQTIIPMLQSAAENNIAVSLLISPHYFPTFVERYYPDINKFHPQYELIMDKYIETLIPLIKDMPALSDICISNEPSMNTGGIASLLPDFQNWLAEKYVTIGDLNHVYKTQYTAFNQINMPVSVAENRAFYDWTAYNDTKHAAWHKRIADKIREYMPNAKLHSKVTDYLAQNGSTEFERNRMFYGLDMEQFSEFSDLMGNDAHAYYNYNLRPVQGVLKWYDFLTSMKEVPVFNSEDHIISDKSTQYSTDITKFATADIFQGALHGRTATAIWSWVKSADPDSIYSGNIMQRPDTLAGVGKASLDLNRLAYEVTAFNEKKAKVAILYSTLERVYNKNYFTVMDQAYDACLYAGQKVRFVTTNQLQALLDYDCLIIPNITHADEATLNAIQDFKNAGKTVFLLGECFVKNEFNEPISFDKTGYTTLTMNEASYPGLLHQIYNTCHEIDVRLHDANGNFTKNVEWNAVVYKGRTLINVCNYTWSDIAGLQVIYKGEPVEVKDLISMENKGNAFTAKAFEPMLLEIKSENPSFIKEAYVENGILYTTIENPDAADCQTKISAKYYNKNAEFIKGGGIYGTIRGSETLSGNFAFGNNGSIWLGIMDASGILIEERTFPN